MFFHSVSGLLEKRRRLEAEPNRGAEREVAAMLRFFRQIVDMENRGYPDSGVAGGVQTDIFRRFVPTTDRWPPAVCPEVDRRKHLLPW